MNPDIYPGKGRAAVRFDAFNQRYAQFLDTLPEPVNTLGRQENTYLGGESSRAFGGLQSMNPVLVGIPWLFWDCFGALEEEPFLRIAEAGACFVLASILLDHLVDDQVKAPEPSTLFQQALYAHAQDGFRELFPSGSPFWAAFVRLGREHLAGLALELETQHRPSLLCARSLKHTAHGKVAPIVVTVAALSQASAQPHLLAPLEQSLKRIAVASQLLDDIGDWEHDLQVGHWTYYLKELATKGIWNSESMPAQAQCWERLNAEWLDATHLEQVLKFLEESLAAVDSIPCQAWEAYIGGYLERAQEHLKRAYAGHLKRRLAPLVRSREIR